MILATSTVVLHPVRASLAGFVRRGMSAQGVGAPAVRAARQRLETLFSLPADQLLGAAPGAVVIAFERVRQLRMRRGNVVEIDVAGLAKPWRLSCMSKTRRDELLAAIQELVVARVPVARQGPWPAHSLPGGARRPPEC